MAKRGTRVVLVSHDDRDFTGSCEKALLERGIGSVAAYNCWSAETAQQSHDAAAVAIDGRMLCDFASPDRPGPLLGLSPKLPVVVFNASELDEQQRSAALAHDASLLDGEDAEEIARAVEGLLTPS